LIKEHNLLTSNKLPQLEKRGGDEKWKINYLKYYLYL
jgi:hypothetical protein